MPQWEAAALCYAYQAGILIRDETTWLLVRIVVVLYRVLNIFILDLIESN